MHLFLGNIEMYVLPCGPDSAAWATTTPNSFSAVLNW